MLLSACVCKSIVKPVYAELSVKKEQLNLQEVNNLAINIEENIIQEAEEIIVNDIPTNIVEEIPIQKIEEITEKKEIMQEEIVQIETPQIDNVQQEEPNSWRLIIPAINLDAGIKEGTSQEILNTNIGHLENTAIFEGTIGLCAHNRGYSKNYFAELKNLNVGEVVQYVHPEYGKKYYSVIDKQIISSNDWTYTEQSVNNRLVLFTCVENEPSSRLVVICE